MLKQLVERCLDDDSDERPAMNEISEMIEPLKVHKLFRNLESIMNHDSGFIIGIAVDFLKILIEQSPKTSLRKQTRA